MGLNRHLTVGVCFLLVLCMVGIVVVHPHGSHSHSETTQQSEHTHSHPQHDSDVNSDHPELLARNYSPASGIHLSLISIDVTPDALVSSMSSKSFSFTKTELPDFTTNIQALTRVFLL